MLQKAEAFGVIESVKTASDLYAPVAGEVIAVNEALAGEPELVNSAPYAGGWMVRLRLDDPAAADGLLDAAAYRDTDRQLTTVVYGPHTPSDRARMLAALDLAIGRTALRRHPGRRPCRRVWICRPRSPSWSWRVS